ncbi:hypothetical protein [Frankia sp. AgW1.1]|nr:hypothetical protein [Frankia sp. AgW1.1]
MPPSPVLRRGLAPLGAGSALVAVPLTSRRAVDLMRVASRLCR